MSKLDFTNMAPKIGFYQEDTVSVMPKYNMNSAGSPPCFTADSNGNELMFFIADDGGPDRVARLYKAYRTSNKQQFMFDNNPVEPSFCNTLGSGVYPNNVYSCDNDYIVIGCSDGRRYIVNTQQSYDASYWSTGKDISSIFDGSNRYRMRYNKEWGVIILFEVISCNWTVKYWFKVSVYRYSDLALLKTFELEGPKMYYVAATSANLSVSKNVQSQNFADCDINSIIGWGYPGNFNILIFEKQGLITFDTFSVSLRSYLYDWNNNKQQVYWGGRDCHFHWKIPVSYFQNNGTGNGAKIDLVPNGFQHFWYGSPGSSTRQLLSYDSFNEMVYSSIISDNRPTTYAIRVPMDQDRQYYDNTSPYKDMRTGVIDGDKTHYAQKYVQPPDASPWGKFIYRAVIWFDKLFFPSQSKNKDGLQLNFNYIRKVQLMKGRGSQGYIEPIADEYISNAYSDIVSKLSPILDLNQTRWLNTTKYLTTARESNNNCIALYSNYDGTKLQAFRIGFTETTSDYQFTTTAYRSINFDISTKIPNYSGMPLALTGVYHNPLANNWILFCSTRQSGPTKIPVFFVVNSGGGVTSFNNIVSKYPTEMVNYINQVQGYNLNTNDWQMKSLVVLNNTTVIINILIELGTYQTDYNLNFALKVSFNSSFTNFTAEYLNYSHNWPNMSTHATHQPGIFLYSGPKLGLVSVWSDTGWVSELYTWIRTQKPLTLQNTGDPVANYNAGTYTDDQFLKMQGYNQYWLTLRSSIGLVCYIPNVSIFLGGYFSVMEDSIQIALKPNAKNYIYMERPSDSRTDIIGFASTNKMIPDGARQFSRILIADITTDAQGPVSINYYHINTGYNDYMFHHNQYYF